MVQLLKDMEILMKEQVKTSYQLPELPYDFNALEPVISAEIMQLHYQKHHQGYVTNLNAALEKYHEAESRNDVAQMIALQAAVKFNGGGHINHSIFWTILNSPSKSGGGPKGDLAKMIERDFGSFDTFKEKFNTATIAIQGSGWGWLGYSKANKKLEIATCSNQDPLSAKNLVPIIGVDVWEHAYYLQYKNVRADYVKAIWQIFYWKAIEERFSKAIGG
jgi:Fe-Mn family superoxide dismutase